MSDIVGPVNVGIGDANPFLGRELANKAYHYSERTAANIDQEVRELITKAYDEAMKIIEDKKDLLEAISELLLEKELVAGDEILALKEKFA